MFNKFTIAMSVVLGLGQSTISFGDPLTSLVLRPTQSIVIDTSKKFQNTKLGGFSGLYLKGNQLFAVTDDRGRFGEPRLYRFDISETKTKSALFELKLQEKISLIKKTKKLPVYDLEAVSGYGGGWLVSSEGDLNAKPKIAPEIMFVKNKVIQNKLELPSEFLPKFEGKQIAGFYNNKAFEGLYFDEPKKRLYLVSESGLVQNKDGDQVFYILEFAENGGKFVFQKKSRLDFTELIGPNFVYNGASDFVKVADNTFLLLSRSVQAALSLQYTNIVWLIKRKSENDPWEVKGKYILNPDGDSDDLNQNYEGLVIYESDGKKYLIMVSDDNFNKFEKTVFSFFELEVK
tara:strand:+ start:172307 stop:173344 length:1038 start_codon:yes stop_codon:yes gene_type:complete